MRVRRPRQAGESRVPPEAWGKEWGTQLRFSLKLNLGHRAARVPAGAGVREGSGAHNRFSPTLNPGHK